MMETDNDVKVERSKSTDVLFEMAEVAWDQINALRMRRPGAHVTLYYKPGGVRRWGEVEAGYAEKRPERQRGGWKEMTRWYFNPTSVRSLYRAIREYPLLPMPEVEDGFSDF